MLRGPYLCKKSRGFTFEIARTLLRTRSAVAESLDHLDMTRHADTRIDLRRSIEQRLRFFAIAGRRAIDQHHCVETLYLRLLEQLRQRLRLLDRNPKMIFGGFPLTRPRRGDSRDRLRQTPDWPKCYCAGGKQLANQRI